MITENTAVTAQAAEGPDWRQELSELWHSLPNRGVFLTLLVAWAVLFHFLGNSVLGYVRTDSLFGWMWFVFTTSKEDEFGQVIPLVVMGIMIWRRRELLEATKGTWWPGLLLVIIGLLLHLTGFLVQQTRISIVGFFGGIYGLMGLLWGRHWLKATFFPFFLFGFCVPMGNELSEHSFQLRLVATVITEKVCQTGLGINVLRYGTMLFDANGTYQYDVEAACSGLRSLTVMLAMNTVVAFLVFKAWWRRGVMILMAVPLAMAANVLRLSSIVIAGETFGQKAGNTVHDSWWMSLIPYVLAFGGAILMRRWLSEERESPPPTAAGAVAELRQGL